MIDLDLTTTELVLALAALLGAGAAIGFAVVWFYDRYA